MEFYEVIRNRRSIRKYQDRAIPEDVLRRVLDAARIAPSAANRQPWHYYVIRDEELKSKLRGAYGKEWFYTAPVVICACAVRGEAWRRKMDGKIYADVDVTISMDHLILAAEAEGLGTCWIAAFDPAVTSDVLGLPEGEEPVVMTPLGYPAEDQAPTPRKDLDAIVTFL